MSPDVQADPLFSSAGEVAQRLAAFRWDRSPLGAPVQWPSALRLLVRIVLTADTPMCLTWGPQSILIYNDAFAAAALGVKHPAAMARPVAEVWGETWNDIGAAHGEAMPLLVQRRDAPREVHLRFTCVPAASDRASAEHTGMLWLAEDETAAVLADRRASALAALDARLTPVASPHAVLAAVEEASSRDVQDLPFVLVYELADDGPHLSAHAGLAAGDATKLPADLIQRLTGYVPRDLPPEPAVVWSPPGIAWPAGPWGRPARQLVSMPLVAPGRGTTLGVLVAGINPLVPADAHYLQFVRVFATLVAAGLAAVRAPHGESDPTGEFLTSLGHRLRTPLNTILAWSQILQRSEDAADRQRGIETITRSARAQAQMLDEMLDGAGLPAHAQESAPAGTRDVDLSGVTALVVDDDDDARVATARILEQAGAAVVRAASGAEGLARLATRAVDLIVSDITMPGMDGLVFIQAVRARGDMRDLPAIALTSLVSPAESRRALAAGFTRHLPKPVDAGNLVRAAAEMTGRLRPTSH